MTGKELPIIIMNRTYSTCVSNFFIVPNIYITRVQNVSKWLTLIYNYRNWLNIFQITSYIKVDFAMKILLPPNFWHCTICDTIYTFKKTEVLLEKSSKTKNNKKLKTIKKTFTIFGDL